MAHKERHRAKDRGSWLRASVLGANDGIVSTASLVLGVAAADASTVTVLTAGTAGLVGGALSMGVGEYVSVSSQRDAEEADLALERRELREQPARELAELAGIYVGKGLPPELAHEVAVALTTHADPLVIHARDELDIDVDALARPVQAAVTSTIAFAAGALLPLLAMVLPPPAARMVITFPVTLVALGLLGALSAHLGGAPMKRATVRVVGGGLAAMSLTAALGYAFGAWMP